MREEKFPVKHTKWKSIPLEIENPAGTVRSGVSRNGHRWSTKMKHHYGRIPNTEGLDGDSVDVYLNAENPKSDLVFKIHTKNPETGEFDESKWMLGFSDQRDAEQAFYDHYDQPDFFGYCEQVPFQQFQSLVMKKKISEHLTEEFDSWTCMECHFKSSKRFKICPRCHSQEIENLGESKSLAQLIKEVELIIGSNSPVHWDAKENVFSAEMSDLGNKAPSTPNEVIFLKNPKTGTSVKFYFTHPDKDGSGEDTYGWWYKSSDGKYKLLLVND